MKRLKKIIQETISPSEYDDLLIRKYAEKANATEKEKYVTEKVRNKGKISGKSKGKVSMREVRKRRA